MSDMNYQLKPGVTSVMFSVDGENVVTVDGPYSTDDPQIMGLLDVTFASSVERVAAPAKNDNLKDAK